MLSYLENSSPRAVLLNCAGSCVYLIAILFFLLFTDQKYDLGKLPSLLLSLIVLLLEFVKLFLNLCICPSFDDSSNRRDERTFVFKKHFKVKFKEIFKCLLLCGIAVFCYFMIFIVFGAEVFSKHEETLMLSVLLCVLTVVHACVNLGSQSAMNAIFGTEPQSSIGKMVQRNIYGTWLGTWFGAFFIPLDWDKPWQEWPITCALGGLFGFTVSNIMSMCIVLHQQSKREKHGRKIL